MSFETDPFQEETDLQAWSEDMGIEYEIGQQGSAGMPIRDMSDARLDATIDSVTRVMRESSCLPVLPDEQELSLHRKQDELDEMSEPERIEWFSETIGWLIEHPNATINDLID